MAALRAVLASDFMAAAGAELPYALLKKRAAASLAKRAAIWREGLQAVKRCVLRLRIAPWRFQGRSDRADPTSDEQTRPLRSRSQQG